MGIKYIEHKNGTSTPDKVAVEYAVKDSAGNIIKDTYLKNIDTIALSHGGTGIAESTSGANWYNSDVLHPHFELYMTTEGAFTFVFKGSFAGTVTTQAEALTDAAVVKAFRTPVPVYLANTTTLLFTGLITSYGLTGNPTRLFILFPDTIDFDGNLVNGIRGTIGWTAFDGFSLTSVYPNIPGMITYADEIVESSIGTSAVGSSSQPVYWTGSAFAAGNTIPSTAADIGAAASNHQHYWANVQTAASSNTNTDPTFRYGTMSEVRLRESASSTTVKATIVYNATTAAIDFNFA